MKAIILHGTMGSPEGNWFPWLAQELDDRGVRVAVPRLPTPEGQSLDAWVRVLSQYDSWFGDSLILVAHSMSPALVLNKLQTAKAHAAFLVSPFVSAIGSGEYDTLNQSFYNEDLDWAAIKSNCPKFFLYAGDNDPYVPMDKVKFIADKLGAEPTIIPEGGHLNEEFGYTEFTKLLLDIDLVIR